MPLYHAAAAAHTPKQSHSPAPSTLIPGTTSTLTPIDLSSSVSKTPSDSARASTSKDMSPGMDEVQDFSMPNKNKQPQQTKSKLDDMLNKLMQRKNCPVPVDEPVVGKEKKRRKLDEIVLGLSAAKEQQSEPKKSSQPSVSVTMTKSSVPSSKSTFLAQAEQHNLLMKQQQQLQQQLLQQQQAIKMAQPNSATAAHVQRKTYEAMIADISKVADFSAKISSYSHEAKVNKWLAEQTSMIPEQSLGADFLGAPRRRRPRVDPTLLDWKKLTGEENVSVINRMTGKKLTGSKAPQLKRLAQWLLENPMYDVDPKWADLVKEKGNLPHDLQKRLPQSERKKGPGRPPLLSSPTGSQTPATQSSSTLPTANLPFPSLASSLGGINPSALLSGLSLGGFDPKNNPLLLPFGGMSNMSALSGMSGLGNMSLTNSLFANLAGLGLPSLAGMDSSSLTNPATSTASDQKTPKSHKTPESKATTKATPVSSSSSSTLPTSLPFFFPNPSLLYTPLGLGGLNPFTLQPGSMSSAYDSLALLNGGLGVNATQAQSRTHKNTSSTTSVSSGRASTVTSASTSQSKQHQQRLPAQFLLPHDTHLLESLTRTAKPKQSRPSSYSREQEMKEALETLSKSSTEVLPRAPSEERTSKRSREEAFPTTPVDLAGGKRSPSPMSKKSKDSPVPSPSSKASNYSGGLDLSNHFVPEERTKTPPIENPPPPIPPSEILSEEVNASVNDRPLSPEGTTQESLEPEERAEEFSEDVPSASEETSLPPSETKDESAEGEGDGESTTNGGKGKKRRGKKSVEVGQRKMLRSSAGRAAAAAQRARENHSN